MEACDLTYRVYTHKALSHNNTCTSENLEILRAKGLLGARLDNLTGFGILEDIALSQVNRSFYGCSEPYRKCLYQDEKKMSYAVFIALNFGDPPDSIMVKTMDQNGCRLFFGSCADQTFIFFVIHPPAWLPYQKHFRAKIAGEVLAPSFRIGDSRGNTAPHVSESVGVLTFLSDREFLRYL